MDYLKHIYLFILLFFLIIIGFVIWDFIYLPFNKDLVGYEGFGEKYYHPQNDTLKFFLLINFCLFFFYYFFSIFFKQSKLTYKELFQDNINENKKLQLNYLFFFFITLILIDFLGFNFKKLISEIDIFHEGLWLTPSMNYKITNSFWDTSFIERGIGGNFFPVFAWYIFSNESIGSSRLLSIIFLLFNKIFLVFVCKHLSENLYFEKRVKCLFFLILAAYSISLVEYPDMGYGYFDTRYSLLLFFILILFKSFRNNNNYSFCNFFLGLFSSISILWFVDIGLYTNILLFLYLIYLIFRKNFKIFLSLIAGIFISWLFFCIFFSLEEIKSFAFNLYQVTKSIEFIGSIKYPSPLFGNDGRATKTLFFFIIAGAAIIYLIFYKKISISNNNKISLLFFYVLSLISFKYALGRSDSYHIKGGSGFLMLLLGFIFLFFLFYFFLKFRKNYYNLLKKNNYIIFLFLFLFLFSFNLFNLDKIKNILNFKENNNILVNAPKEGFLTKDYINLIITYQRLLLENNQDCVQIFTDEIAIPYLVSKKTCTKYYAMITATPKEIQINFIEELRTSRPKIILFKSNKFEFNSIEERLKLVSNFIRENYNLYYEFNDWIFYKLSYSY